MIREKEWTTRRMGERWQKRWLRGVSRGISGHVRCGAKEVCLCCVREEPEDGDIVGRLLRGDDELLDAVLEEGLGCVSGCLEGDGETDEGGDHGAAGLETMGDFVGLNEE